MAMQKGVNPSVVFQQRRWRFPKMGAPKSPSVSILKCSFMTWRIWGYPYFGKSPNSSKPIAFYAKMFAPVCIRNEGWCVSSDVWIWTRTSQNCMTTIGGHSWVKAGICCFFKVRDRPVIFEINIFVSNTRRGFGWWSFAFHMPMFGKYWTPILDSIYM